MTVTLDLTIDEEVQTRFQAVAAPAVIFLLRLLRGGQTLIAEGDPA